jgi:hypothetical protein
VPDRSRPWEDFVLIACWSPKGGCGTTVVSVAIAMVLAERAADGVLIADLCGDVPGVLGADCDEADGPGLAQWLAASGPPEALARIEVAVTPRLSLLLAGGAMPLVAGGGDGPGGDEQVAALAVTLAADRRPVVADCGTIHPGRSSPGSALAAAAGLSLLVLRPCYTALRRAVDAPVRPSAVVLVEEPHHKLGRQAVEAALGVPVRAVVDVHPKVARAVDAGLLNGGLPRPFYRAIRRAA